MTAFFRVEIGASILFPVLLLGAAGCAKAVGLGSLEASGTSEGDGATLDSGAVGADVQAPRSSGQDASVASAAQDSSAGGDELIAQPPPMGCQNPYSLDNCLDYMVGDTVLSGGHKWLCSVLDCENCATNPGCAPGGTGCPWGMVWMDQGTCP